MIYEISLHYHIKYVIFRIYIYNTMNYNFYIKIISLIYINYLNMNQTMILSELVYSFFPQHFKNIQTYFFEKYLFYKKQI